MRSIRNAREDERRGRGKSILLAVVLGVLIFSVFYFIFSKPSESPDPEAGTIGIVEQTPPGETGSPEGEKPPAQQATAPTGGATEEKKEDFTFFKTLKEKQEPVPLQPEKPVKSDETSFAAVAPPGEAPKVEEAPTAPKSPPKTPKVEPGEKVQRIEKVEKPRTDVKRYTIQVAALNVERPALELAERLKKRGYPSYVVAARRPEVGTIYRVRVGRFSSRAEAEKLAERIRQREQLNFFITLAEG